MNVLLVRADGIGDALACAPLVAALGDAGHRVSAVFGVANQGIYARRAFDAVHVLERIPWPRHGSTPESRAAALAAVRAARYDVALVASEEMDAFVFARDAGIPQRVGFENGWAKPLKSLRVRSLVTRALVRPASAGRAREHEVETMFALGADLVREPRPTRDVARLRPLVFDLPPRPHGSVVLAVSRKLAHAGLDVDTFASLARALLVRGIAVLAVGDDPAALDAVGRASGAAIRPDLDVASWKRILGGARAVITPDSGAAHVAGMGGVPCVDCFAPGDALGRDVARWHPWASRYRAVALVAGRGRPALVASLVRALGEVCA